MQFYQTKNFKEAIKYFELALEALDLINFEKVDAKDKNDLCRDFATYQSTLAHAYKHLNNLDKAIYYLQFALFIRQIADPLTLQDIEELVQYRLNIADSHLKQTNLTAAIEEYIEIVDYLQQHYPDLLPKFTSALADGMVYIMQNLASRNYDITFSPIDLAKPNFFTSLIKLLDMFQTHYAADLSQSEAEEVDGLKQQLTLFNENVTLPIAKAPSPKLFKQVVQANELTKESLETKPGLSYTS